MRHALHHYTWLLRRFRGVLFLYAILWAAAAFVSWGTSWGIRTDDYAYGTHLWLLVAGGLVWLRAVQQDPVPGTEGFWRTRPVRWRSLWASQLAFLLTGIAGPPLACWLLNGLLLDNTAVQWSQGLWDAAIIMGPLLAVAAVASFASGGRGLAVAFGAAGVAWFLGAYLFMQLGARGARGIRPGGLELLTGLLLLLPVAALVIAWTQGLKRGHLTRRGADWCGLLLVLPVAGSYLLPVAPGWQDLRTLRIHPPGPLEPRAHDFGGMQLLGVPEGLWPLLRESTVRAPGDFRAGGFIGKETVTSLPAAAFASLLPPGTRWYHSLPERQAQRWQPQGSAAPWSELRGEVRGVLIAPEVLASLPLANGAVHAQKGLRLRMRGFHASEKSLTLAADVFLAASLGQTIRSRLTADSGRLQGVIIPVLHFPHAGFAIATSPAKRELFRTWQTDALTIEISAAVPLAETLLGATWSPETFRDARLLLCHLRPAGEFVAEPSGEVPPP